jgi:DNA (cytosine-5)-methyltransferase 1
VRLSCVDAFCGAGGLSLGLQRAGFDLPFAFDVDASSMATYRNNLGHLGELMDVRAVSGRDLTGLPGVAGELDLLAGGPPCQGFSKQKRGAHLGDRRNALVLEFLRLVEESMPRAFLLENVAQLGQVRGKRFLDGFHALDNYRLLGRFYVAADYGVAQTRERYILVGVRRDVAGDFAPPKPTTPVWPTVGQVIGDLPEPPADYAEHPEFPNHQAARVTAINVARFSHVPEGGGWQDIPEGLRLPCHRNVDTSRGGWPDVYGRLRWDGQCPTITGGFDSFTRGRYGHPRSDRPLTPREAARLQGFPDSHAFVGTRHDVRHQIGNAVPVPLATAVGESLAAALLGTSKVERQLSFEPVAASDQEPREIVLK